MKETIELTIRVATIADAQALIDLSKTIGQETTFLSFGPEGLNMSVAQEEKHLENVANSDNNIIFVASVDNQLVGVASISAVAKPKMKHIGEMGIMVLKDYRGFGIGPALFDSLIDWAKKTTILKRLELTVQEPNHKAIALYESRGFVKEALMPYGVCVNGNYLNVWLMSLIIDK